MRFIDVSGLLVIDRAAIRTAEPPLVRLCAALQSQTVESVERRQGEVVYRPRRLALRPAQQQPARWLFGYFTSGSFRVGETAATLEIAYRAKMLGPFLLFTTLMLIGGSLAALDSGVPYYPAAAVGAWWIMFAVMRISAERRLRRWLGDVLTSSDLPPVGALEYP